MRNDDELHREESIAKMQLLPGTTGLLTGILLIGFTWLIVLPAMANLAPISNYLIWLDSKKIDPSAMFYTELEVADELLIPKQTQTNETKKP